MSGTTSSVLSRLLLDDPKNGYKELISFKFNLPPVYRKDSFWNNWNDYKQIPHSNIRSRLSDLHVFHQSKLDFKNLFDEQKQVVEKLSRKKRVALFFQIYQQEFKSRDYNQGFVDRITFLSEAIGELMDVDERGDVDVPESLDANAPYFYYNTRVFEEIADAYVYGGFGIFAYNDDFVIEPTSSQAWGVRQNELIKNRCLSNAYAFKHEDDVSDLKHFNRVDSVLNTAKGLMALIVSNGKIVSTAEGTFGLEGSELDKVEESELICKQQISYLYRKEIESCFEPKFATFFKDVIIKKGDTNVCLYDVVFFLAAIKALVAYYSPYLNGQHCVEFDTEQLTENLGYFDELTEFSREKVVNLLKYLIQEKTPGIAKIEATVFFSVPVFTFFPISKYMFDRRISEVFYKQTSIDCSNIKEHKRREQNVIEKLKVFFPKEHFISFDNVNLNEVGFIENGEVDLIVVSPIEKRVFVIEVKLENTVSYRWINKARWIDEHISKAKEQHSRNERFINSSEGKSFFRNREIEVDGNWIVEYFLVSDNMLCDHFPFIFNKETKKRFLKISIFELECLLNQAEVFKPHTKNWIAYHVNHMQVYRQDIVIPQDLLDYINDKNDYSQNDRFVIFIEENRILKHQKIHSLRQLAELITDEIIWKLPQSYIDSFSYELKTEVSKPSFMIRI